MRRLLRLNGSHAFGGSWPWRAIILFLAVLTVILLIWLASLWSRPFAMPSNIAGRSAGMVVGKESLTKKLQGGSAYNIIVDRDIFSPTRQKYVRPEPPKPSKPVPQAQPSKPLPRLSLVGTVLLDDGEAAMINGGTGRDTSLYKVGDSIEGFVVKEIQKDMVLLEREGESMIVRMNQSSMSSSEAAVPSQYIPNGRVAPATPVFMPVQVPPVRSPR